MSATGIVYPCSWSWFSAGVFRFGICEKGSGIDSAKRHCKPRPLDKTRQLEVDTFSSSLPLRREVENRERERGRERVVPLWAVPDPKERIFDLTISYRHHKTLPWLVVSLSHGCTVQRSARNQHPGLLFRDEHNPNMQASDRFLCNKAAPTDLDSSQTELDCSPRGFHPASHSSANR